MAIVCERTTRWLVIEAKVLRHGRFVPMQGPVDLRNRPCAAPGLESPTEVFGAGFSGRFSAPAQNPDLLLLPQFCPQNVIGCTVRAYNTAVVPAGAKYFGSKLPCKLRVTAKFAVLQPKHGRYTTYCPNCSKFESTHTRTAGGRGKNMKSRRERAGSVQLAGHGGHVR